MTPHQPAPLRPDLAAVLAMVRKQPRRPREEHTPPAGILAELAPLRRQ